MVGRRQGELGPKHKDSSGLRAQLLGSVQPEWAFLITAFSEPAFSVSLLEIFKECPMEEDKSWCCWYRCSFSGDHKPSASVSKQQLPTLCLGCLLGQVLAHYQIIRKQSWWYWRKKSKWHLFHHKSLIQSPPFSVKYLDSICTLIRRHVFSTVVTHAVTGSRQGAFQSPGSFWFIVSLS